MAESHRGARTPAAAAAPASQGIYILAGPPSHLPSQGPHPAPAPKSREPNPKKSAPRWSVAILAVLLALSCLLWALLLALSMKNQAEMREELELLRWNSSGSWDQAWQELQQTRAEVQQHDLKLRGITELLCRTIEDSRKCPAGWEFFGGGCYLFSQRALGWAGARSACAAFGAHLVVVSTEQEQTFLMSRIQGNGSFWLGVTDEQHEGKWAWVTGETPNFGFWDVWEEDAHREHKDCGAMKPNGRWSNERCSRPLRWVCEKSWHC